MSLRSKTSLILSISFLLLTTLAQAQQIYCDPNNRPTFCSNKIPWQNVCSHYTNDCPLEVCGRQDNNACQACQNFDTVYYEIGECNPAIVLQNCLDWEEEECGSGSEFHHPLCAYKNENDQHVSKTFLSRCELCRPESTFQYFQEGPCEKDKNYCDEKYCKKGTVCALFPTEDFQNVYSPVPNAALACSDPELEFFLKGNCGPLSGDWTFCLPNARPQTCPEENNPVCGFYKNENGRTESRMVDSPCEACADPAIQYHLPSCESYCEYFTEEEESVSCGSTKQFICGTYIENGEEKRISAWNDCIGCYFSDVKLVSFVYGLCPGDTEDDVPRVDEGGDWR